MSRGWQIAINALKVLGANKQLIIFPILSGLTILMVISSFFFGITFTKGFAGIDEQNTVTIYGLIFLFYMVSYFIVVFFNMALIHCTTLYFKGEEASISKGINFSFSRIWLIFSWAVFAATIGTLLKILQDNLGQIGKFVISILGFAWSAATFFAVPVIAYEKLMPLDATKRSFTILKEKWGQSVVANFSFGLLTLLAFLVLGIAAIAVSELINMELGIALFAVGVGIIAIITSAIKTIIISAAYHNIDNNMDIHFNRQLLDGLFVEK